MWTLTNRSLLQLALDNPALALEDASRADHLEPGNPSTLREKGLSLLRLGNTERALSTLQEIEKPMDGSWINYFIGAAKIFTAQKEECEDFFSEGISLGSVERESGLTWDGSYFNSAMCHIGLGEIDEGLALIRELLTRGPQASNIREALANLTRLRPAITEHLDAYDEVVRLLTEWLDENGDDGDRS